MNYRRHRLLLLVLGALAPSSVLNAPAVAAPARGGAARHVQRRVTPAPPPGPAAAVATNPASDERYVFWRTPSGRIDESWYNSSWHGPVSRGWSAASAPSAAVNAAGSQFVAWAGREGDLYSATFIRGHWHRSADLTRSHHWGARGQTSTAPDLVVDPASNHLFLFWRTPGGRIFEAYNTGRWHGPFNLGWNSATAPSAAIRDDGRLYLFGLSSRGDILEAIHGTRWSRPQDLTRAHRWGRATSAPAAAVNPRSGVQYLFWRGTGTRIREAWNPGRWHRPVVLGWTSSAAPRAAASADSRQYVVWLGSRGVLTDAWYRSAWTPPVSRWRLSAGAGAYAEVVETTSNLSRRMTPLADVQFAHIRTRRLPVIRISDRQRYQQVKGIGAAMTDTSAWLIQDHLSPAARARLMDELFTTDGIHLGFTLIPMGGSDFSVGGQPYTYDDLPAGQTDPNLTRFSIAHDQAYILPVLRQMLSVAPGTETFAVPWSPPAWMKANDALGDLKHQGTLLAADYAPFANYFVRFLEAYAQQGVPIQAIAPENEPRAASAFPSMYFPAPQEENWIANYLVPALKTAKLTSKLYGNDTSWQIEDYAMSAAHSAAASQMKGIAWHCYNGIPTVMTDLHGSSPSLDQIVTECAPNLSRFGVPDIVIGAMRNWASEVTLWNIATDPAGGPVEPPNSGCHGCRGLVTINEATHSVAFNLDYYELGQVGSFVQSGARRIGSNSLVSFQRTTSNFGATPGLDDVALRNPDGSHVLIVYNNTGAARRFAVSWAGRAFAYSLPGHATITFRWNP